MSVIEDNSSQANYLTTGSTLNYYYTQPTIILSSGNGLYSNTTNTIILCTSGITALTIDANQCLYGNGTGFTHLQWTNIDSKPTNFQSDWNSTIINKPTNFQSDWNSTIINKPTNFQSDWNSTVINKPDLSTYALNSNLNSLSSLSFFLTNYTNLNSLNVSGITIFNGASTHISTLNVSGQTTLANVVTCTSSLNVISNITGSGVSLFTLNTNVNNLNTTSTTILTNLNSLSTQSYLDIPNIKSTSTTILTNLNTLSSLSFFLTNYTNLNLLNVSQTSKLNGATTCISSLNVSGISTFNNVLSVSNDIGIQNLNPIGPLCIGDASTTCDGYLFIEKNNGASLNRQYRIGINSNSDLQLGDYGYSNISIPASDCKEEGRVDLTLETSNGKKEKGGN